MTIRDPVKTLRSWYTFVASKDESSPMLPAAFLGDINKFAKSPLNLETGGMGGHPFEYIIEYYLCRNLPNVLLLVFEHMQADPQAAIKRVASFMGVPATPELLEKVGLVTTLDWMSEKPNRTKFDDHMIYDKQKELRRAGFIYNPPASKVLLKPATAVGKSKYDLSEATLTRLEKDWTKMVTRKTGFKTYQAMADALAAEKSGLSDVPATPLTSDASA